jgi:hypothetical protein
MSDFKYSEHWQDTKRTCKNIYCKCTQNPLHTGNIQIHHLKYTRSIPRRIAGICLLHNPLERSVSGYEIPGWDIVPLCEACHENNRGRGSTRRSVHHPSRWIQTGGLGNRNTFDTQFCLRTQFLFWALIFNLFKLIGINPKPKTE